MKRFGGSIPVAAATVLLVAATITVRGDAGSSTVNQQLAEARAATAQYHDFNEALADGYIGIGSNPEEGGAIEFVNLGLVDCTLDPRHPEALRYVESGQGLRLIAVEYAIPMACGDGPPEDFLSGVGEWEPEAGVPVWMMPAFVWSGASADSDSLP
jgi:hypothetical protein